MAKDFRASQVQTTQIISSGSSGTNARIVVYPVEKQSGASPNQGIIDPDKFSTGSIGVDTFIFVSGGIGERNTINNSIAVFGGDVHISGNLTSDQQIFGEGESLFRLGVVDYATTENTSSNPLVAGQVAFPGNEFSGSSLTLRAILANTTGSGIAAVKLFNLDSLTFVDINGPSQQELAVTGTTPTLVESVNLLSASGFTTGSLALYELQLFSNSSTNTAQVGGGELRPSGSFTANTIITSSVTVISGNWIDDNSRLRTTASVAIDSDGNFANEKGSDNYFYVSGTINSWTTASLFGNRSISVFGGDVRISGSVIGGSGSVIQDNFPGGTTGSNSPFNFIGGGVNHTITPFSNGQETSTAGTTARNFIGAGTANTITQSSDSAIVGGKRNQISEGVLSGAFIGAGSSNSVNGNDATQVAGFDNSVGGDRAFGGAGDSNVSSADDGFVGAGANNVVALGANRSAIVGGSTNNIQNGDTDSFIGAGTFNTIDAKNSAIVAGTNNIVDFDANHSFIGAGQNNRIDTLGATLWEAILVGSGNRIQGFSANATNYSVILGGQSNLIVNSASLLYGFDLTSSFSEGNTIQFGSRISGKRPYRFVVSASKGSVFHGGLSGSLTTLTDGSPYLIAGTNITLSTGSSGAVTINSTGGGGGADSDWTLTGSTLYTTSSIVVGQQTTTNPIGEDVFFFVSGTFGSGSAVDAVSVFGGDVRISGTLAVGTGSVFIKDDSIFFGSASIRNVGGQLQFFDDNNLAGQTLQQLATGSGGGETSSLQQAYNLNNVVTTSVASGSFTLFANDDTHSPFVISASAHSTGDPPIIDIRTGTGSPEFFRVIDTANKEFMTIEKAGNFDSRINMRSEGSFGISYGWLNNTNAGIGLNTDNIRFQVSSGDSFEFVSTEGVVAFTISAGGSIAASSIVAGVSVAVSSTLGVTDTIRARGGLAVDPGANISETTYGTDAIMVVSGVVGGKDSTANSTALFLGDVHISGNLTVDGTAPGGGGSSFFYSDTANVIEQSGSLEMSGSGLFKSGLTGALNVLPDGSPFIVGGGDVSVSSASNGRITVSANLSTSSSLIQLSVVDYTTTTATSSNPAALGQIIFDPSDYTGNIILKSVLSAASSSVTASVRLFNVTSGALVHIGGAGQTEITSVGTTPTIVESVNLRNATNFSAGAAIYEFQAFTSDESQLVTVGGGEIRTNGLVDKSIPITGSLLSFGIADYATTNSTSSNPEAVGQLVFDPSEYTGPIKLRAVLASTTGSVTASMRLFNVTSGSLVHIGGSGVTVLETTSVTPELVESVNLRDATNFSTNQAIYELQLYTTTGSQSAIVGSAEFRVTGSVTAPPTRLSLGSYTTTTATSSNPQAVGGGYFVPSEHNTNLCVFRAVLSTTTASNTAFAQLYNITSGALVHVGGPGITELSSSANSPTNVESVNLFNATNFNPDTSSVYEVRVYGSGSSSPTTTLVNSELVCS